MIYLTLSNFLIVIWVWIIFGESILNFLKKNVEVLQRHSQFRQFLLLFIPVFKKIRCHLADDFLIKK